MAVPKFRSSKARASRKHSINSKLVLPHLIQHESGNFVARHRIDPTTGMYRNKQIVEEKE